MASKNVTLQEAERHLGELLQQVAQGEEVIITKDDRPYAKLTVLPLTSGTPRVFGQHKGKARLSSDFDAPLSDSFWLDGNA